MAAIPGMANVEADAVGRRHNQFKVRRELSISSLSCNFALGAVSEIGAEIDADRRECQRPAVLHGGALLLRGGYAATNVLKAPLASKPPRYGEANWQSTRSMVRTARSLRLLEIWRHSWDGRSARLAE